jgi:copper chaperone CopZ
MQRKIIVALIGAFALAMAAMAGEPATNKVSLKIEGMNCGMCAEKIETALKAVPGVKDAHVSLLKETAEVEADTTVTVAALSAAVKEAGYSVASDQKEAKAKKKDCAKKCPMMKQKHEDGR